MVSGDGYEDEAVVSSPKWVLVYSDLHPRWPISPGMFNLSDEGAADVAYSFRVRARNAFGFGPYSSPSGPVSVAEVLRRSGEAARSVRGEGFGVLVAVGLAVFLVLCMVAVLFVVTLLRRPWRDKVSPGPSMEMKALRALRRGAGVGSGTLSPLERLDIDNPIYDLDLPTAGEIDSLPMIKRNQIELTRAIGESRCLDFDSDST